MNPQSPEFLFLALVLPSLFALTLIAEGTWKVMRDEPGWVSIVIGVVFLLMIVGAYFLLNS